MVEFAFHVDTRETVTVTDEFIIKIGIGSCIMYMVLRFALPEIFNWKNAERSQFLLKVVSAPLYGSIN